jgi:hypothetical protein
LKWRLEEINILKLCGFVRAILEDEDLYDVFVIDKDVSGALTTSN